MSEPLTPKIVINGKEYATVDEMPPEIRSVYEKAMAMIADKDANGVPDVLEGKGPGAWEAVKQVWGIAREAKKSGIQSVRFTGALTTERSTDTARRVAPPLPAPRGVEPAMIEAGKLKKLLFAIGGAVALVLVLRQLGVLE
jgi:hypothetical protein